MGVHIETAYSPAIEIKGSRTVARAFPYFFRLGVNALGLGIGYAFALGSAQLVGGGLRWWWKGEAMVPEWIWVTIPAWLVGCLYMRLLPGWGLGSVEEMRRTMLLWLAVFGGTTMLLFFFQAGADTSRFTLAVTFVVSIPFLFITRVQVKRLLIRAGCWGVPAVIYGAGRTGKLILEALRSEKGLGFNPVGFFDDSPALEGTSIGELPVIGRCSENTDRASVAILAMPGVPSSRIRELLEGPLSAYRKVIVIPDLFDTPSLYVKTRDFLGVLGLEISNNLSNPLARLLKRTSDIVLVSCTALVWVPLSGFIALFIWLHDGGSPFFLQERVGRNQRTFKMWKFRTMLVDAEEVLERELEKDPRLLQAWTTDFKLRRDPRITWLGAFLRRTSLDELPQLVNVLKGEMSLVGPRPLPPYHSEKLPGRVRAIRQQVRPGMSGLWQVSGRGEFGSSGMERWDPYYVRNWSIWLDIVVLVRTFRAVIHGRGAF